jgi:16S rRNA (cytosine1402-N4)-methyltransferase
VTYHNPVLLHESIEGLSIQPEGRYVDVTFGGGGHSKAILSKLSATGRLVAFDQDRDAQANVNADPRFTLVYDNFRNVSSQLESLAVIPVDGLLADLGVSSHQFDEAERGFSIRFNADLDMRMDQREKLTARQILNYYTEADLYRVLREYGELSNARRVVQSIVKARKIKPINTVDELKAAVADCRPPAKEHTFLAQLFQALRIEVNDELGALRDLLEQSPAILRQGGRLVVISYHSLEDRMVKNYINSGNLSGELTKDLYGNITGLKFRAITRKPVEPGDAEVAVNPRSRSAKMRIAEKL